MILFSSFSLSFEWKQRVSHFITRFIIRIGKLLSNSKRFGQHKIRFSPSRLCSKFLGIWFINKFPKQFRPDLVGEKKEKRKKTRFCFRSHSLEYHFDDESVVNLLLLSNGEWWMVKFVMYLFASVVKINQNEIWVEHWTIYK